MAAERRGRFTIAEDREVRAKYGLIPTAQLARQMRRQPEAVERRARIVFAGAPVTGRWEKHELVQLREYIGVATPEQLALIFRRTKDTVTQALTTLRSRSGTERPFDRDELVDFKRLYGTRVDVDLAAIFGRKVSMIESEAARLCLSKDKAFVKKTGGRSKMPRWEHEAIEKLKELYADTSNQEIARQLGRSVKSVVSKAHQLGLKKNADRLRQMGAENVAKRYGE
jgi:hypothetical protein